MSLIIPITLKRDGVPQDADETPLLTDAGGTYGIKRADTGEIIVEAGEFFTRNGPGAYSYELANPIAGVTYVYSRRLVLGGNTQHKSASVVATAVNTLPSYLMLAEADAMAASLPKLDSYKAADATGRQQLLAGATMRVDASRRWQGRKYHHDQTLEFPRIPHPRYMPIQNGYVQPVSPSYTRVWDWDAVNKVAIVPTRIKLAVLYEADAMGDGERDRIVAAVSAGLTAMNTGSLSEQYRQLNAGQADVAPLCPQAENLVRSYRLQTGELR
ncbi:MAG: DnaT-like ssDNA-binding protein [Tepidisphaeraceae bacterium]